ncbi:chain length determinant protein EpsF [Pseudoduganella umbonata]|uniref:Chain length determinant protein EpsF n=2 Tax=Pseudoduganella umbonata TaxID=864828 RepID=A0A4P8HVD6_9BURK|nr:chain length determinant protein EpsF [Pseudoduganella umbonata]MBB3222344.1 chain length determinant protein EpsF [Pseudoduganella umbonata]QCP12560.1 chain length determinant protein EpsF [Pseudoduganella umbonata]
MKLQQVLYILRARLRTILISLFVIVAASVAINLMLPKTYEASTTLIVNYKGMDPVSGMVMPTALMAGYMATQVEIIQSKAVARGVVDAMKLTESPSTREAFNSATEGQGDIRDWLADLLLRGLAVIPARESGVITITFAGADPQFAAAVANAFADEYQKAAVRLKVEPLKQASIYFSEQSRSLRDKLEQAQARLSKYQQEKGVVSVDNRLDVESARLNDLSSQLVMAQAQVADASSRQNTAEGTVNQSPDVLNNSLVQSLKASLAAAEGKFSEMASRLDVNHPQYLSAKAEVTKLRSELAAQMSATSGSLGGSSRIAQYRAAELKAAVAAQKARILELNRERDELSSLVRDVDGAQRTYDAAISRFSQTSIEGGSNLADVAVLSPAQPPMRPASPRKLVNLALSIVFGTAFGIGLAIVMEMISRRAHSVHDVVDLEIPVLTEMNWSKRIAPRTGLFKARQLPHARTA